MRHTILSQEYEARFVDTRSFPPSTPFLLRGLAAALQDSGSSWTPNVSELANLLRQAPDRDDLVACGGAYGAAKSIQKTYPGPALLLYGSIVNRLFHEEDADLDRAIDSAVEKLTCASLAQDTDVAQVVTAARDRARMGRISQLMRTGFSSGLELSGRYEPQRIPQLARDIVDKTHDVCHSALIDRYAWMNIVPTGGNYVISTQELAQFGDTDPFQEAPPPPATRAGHSLFQGLVPHAQISVAHLITHRLTELSSASPAA